MGLAVNVQVQGLEEVFARMQADLAERTAKVDNAIQNAGIMCLSLAQTECPVDTGNLKNSLTYTRGNQTCTVGTNVSYSWDVELGTVHMRPHPYLFPAYAKAGNALQDALKQL